MQEHLCLGEHLFLVPLPVVRFLRLVLSLVFVALLAAVALRRCVHLLRLDWVEGHFCDFVFWFVFYGGLPSLQQSQQQLRGVWLDRREVEDFLQYSRFLDSVGFTVWSLSTMP